DHSTTSSYVCASPCRWLQKQVKLERMQDRLTMPKISLSGMTVEALMDLRKRVDGLLSERRAELQEQLERMGVVGGARVVRGGGSVFKGKKIPGKYSSPLGGTWAGRGA